MNRSRPEGAAVLTFPWGEPGSCVHAGIGPVWRSSMQLNVEGMTCAHCERAIQQAVAALGGSARVDLASGTVEVIGVEDGAAVRRAIEAEGYSVVDRAATPVRSGCCGTPS